MVNPLALARRRRLRVRTKVRRHNKLDRARLSVFRSSKHMYAQVIDDGTGSTVAAASSLEADLRTALGTGGSKQAAEAVGARVAERAIAAGVEHVVFDRGRYLFHGRVQALADAARGAGLVF